MAISMSLHGVRRPQRAPVGSRRAASFLFGQFYPCRHSVWEKLRPGWGRLGTAWPWLLVP